MVVHDALIPAAAHLLGDDAFDLVEAAVAHARGDLLHLSPVQVQHRPGHELVVRYHAEVAWDGGEPRRETLLAAATSDGAPEGTLVLEADGMQAGVWRYPFDPELPGLPGAVTPSDGERLEVVAYRPTRRAVVRATGPDGTVAYRKVVRPREMEHLVATHTRLGDAGVPVPAVLGADMDAGVLTIAELGGTNLRDVVMTARSGWPRPEAVGEVILDLAAVAAREDLPGTRMGQADAAASHARAIAAVMPEEQGRLDGIVAALQGLAAFPDRDDLVVHGDMYEAQLMVEDGTVTGVLDLDDVRRGDPRDDAANALGHLHVLEPESAAQRQLLERWRERTREALVEQLAIAPADLDLRTAAVIVGLATGPFRAQRDDWRAEVQRRLGMASRLVRRTQAALRATDPEDERSLRMASSHPHPAVRH